MHAVDNLRLTKLAGSRAAAVAVEASSNLQDYSTDALEYSYYVPPPPAAVSPAAGPILGGTRVVVTSLALPAAPDARCMFGDVVVAGSVDNAAGRLACVSPPLPAAAAAAANATLANATGAAVALRTSLNAQDYTDPIDYVAYVPPSLSSLTVVSGLRRRRHGRHRPRRRPRCADGPQVPLRRRRAHGGRHRRRRRRLQLLVRRLLVCTSPPRAPQLGAPFEVSLNNQDYTASNLTFSIYPPPTVALLTPDRGGADGGISVLLNGSGLVDGGSDPTSADSAPRWWQPSGGAAHDAMRRAVGGRRRRGDDASVRL